jgi:IS30 family transposase
MAKKRKFLAPSQRLKINQLLHFGSCREVAEAVGSNKSTVSRVRVRPFGSSAELCKKMLIVAVQNTVKRVLGRRRRKKEWYKVTAPLVFENLSPNVQANTSVRSVQRIMEDYKLYLKRKRDPRCAWDPSYARTPEEEWAYEMSQENW